MSDQFYDEGEPRVRRKVLLATPSYDRPASAYTFAVARSRMALEAEGIQTAYLLLEGNCHVDDARNAIVREFLASDCDELVFLDADVDWEPSALVQLCSRDVDLVGGVYPYRRDGGEQMPVRLKADEEIHKNGLLEVLGLPTGFLKVKRRVFERMVEIVPHYFDKVDETALIFDRPDPDAELTRYGGDIAFCNRWRAMGGKLYADTELRLGHSGKVIVRDSLAAHLRRIKGQTLRHVIDRIRNGTETENEYNELAKFTANGFSADAGLLALLVGVARKCRGPILELGSGMSSVVLAAVSADRVFSFEHIPFYAQQTTAWAEEVGLANVGLCTAPLKDWWYDVAAFEQYLPRKFALGFCDGPPRLYGTRMRFFQYFGERCSAIIVDDVRADLAYLRKVGEWAEANGRTMELMGRAALILKREQEWLKEAA